MLYLGFTLCKVDVEHLSALNLIAAAVGGVAVADISFCGKRMAKTLEISTGLLQNR